MDLAHKLAWYHRIGIPVYHLAALTLVFIYPLTHETLILFLTTYFLQALGISVGYHRLFTHRSFQANRFITFLFALCGALAGQGAMRRWVYHHSMHHRYTDKEGDPHSPHLNSFWYSHVGWRFNPKSYENEDQAEKLWKEWSPEICWLDRATPTIFLLHPIVLGLIGGWAYALWGCFIPIVLLWHVTFTVNSVSHRFGKRLFETPDDSRNSLWLSLMMWGEGWHNNHHASPKNVRLGMRWYQIDFGYYLIKFLEKFGFTHHLIDVSETEIRAALAKVKTLP